ncbi:MerR family transcriptional regulator [Nocardia blacklockiae]|uniref:MerR family transcriptional regulator n=1 Tax=Nocardia blacklockiae TaxID=480036 RepID=UPI0018962D94|nr:MerR family transcriptional regulator [Nocardia blacklockiae]MBF6172201.1 MerR family transcriptional regulator [Nocardia blacklockiae]
MESRNSGSLRTGDVARRSGYSVQQVRNLEQRGILPPATRTASGYRVYDDAHVRSALAYRALAAGTGPVEAGEILRAARERPLTRMLARLDAAHARLDRERRDLDLATAAVDAITTEPLADPLPSDAMTVSELADALGLRPSTLRHWEAAGLLTPARHTTRARRYTPADVRDARIVHQLRLAGYRIPTLRTLLPHLRDMRRGNDIRTALAARDADIEARSRALLEGAAALAALVARER